jgi:hypothetical protein
MTGHYLCPVSRAGVSLPDIREYPARPARPGDQLEVRAVSPIVTICSIEQGGRIAGREAARETHWFTWRSIFFDEATADWQQPILGMVFTLRGELVRVVHARDMNRKERLEYEKAKARFEEDSEF